MFRSLAVIAIGSMLVSCNQPRAATQAPKKEPVVAGNPIQTFDFKCSLAEHQLADAYTEVNRISLDLANNRIDMFAKDKVWNFHSIQQDGKERHELHLAFFGKNIAAWGVDVERPYNFLFDNTNGKVVFSTIVDGKVQWAQFNC